MSLKNKIFLFPLLLIVIFFASIIIIFSPVGQKNIITLPTPTTISIPGDWKIYTNKKYKYTLSYPNNWQVNNLSNGNVFYKKDGTVEMPSINIQIFNTLPTTTNKVTNYDIWIRHSLGDDGFEITKQNNQNINGTEFILFSRLFHKNNWVTDQHIYLFQNTSAKTTTVLVLNDYDSQNFDYVLKQIVSTFKFIN